MSVYTKVTEPELGQWLAHYDVGALVRLQPIAAGIENTNYFVDTARGRYVLTLFERLPRADLPFYLDLMTHLAGDGIPCPLPIADRAGRTLGELNGKPAALVSRLAGAWVLEPGPKHCAEVGQVLGRMHVSAGTYGGALDNPRGPRWWHWAAPQVLPFLDDERRALLEAELATQAAHRHDDLPRAAVHADLFRDNVLFENDRIGGVIDFYFAGVDALLFDVAVTVNDWCVNADGRIDEVRARALLAAYRAERPFTATERAAWPIMLRAAALRFWLSRLYDFHLPRAGELVHAHDPEHFRRILALRVAESPHLPWEG
jgi:homoserine kinase type II